MDLGIPHTVSGMATVGCMQENYFTTGFLLQYAGSDRNWTALSGLDPTVNDVSERGVLLATDNQIMHIAEVSHLKLLMQRFSKYSIVQKTIIANYDCDVLFKQCTAIGEHNKIVLTK